MELLKFIFSSFWIWLGFTIIFGTVLNFILSFYNRTWRHFNIRKHGYPPAHCDGDGDFKPVEKKK